MSDKRTKFRYLFSFTIRPKSVKTFEQKIFGNEFSESILVKSNWRPSFEEITKKAIEKLIPKKYQNNYHVVPDSGVDYMSYTDGDWWEKVYPEKVIVLEDKKDVPAKKETKADL